MPRTCSVGAKGLSGRRVTPERHIQMGRWSLKIWGVTPPGEWQRLEEEPQDTHYPEH